MTVFAVRHSATSAHCAGWCWYTVHTGTPTQPTGGRYGRQTNCNRNYSILNAANKTEIRINPKQKHVSINLNVSRSGMCHTFTDDEVTLSDYNFTDAY